MLTYSPARGAENELAVNSRSMMQIMQALASHVDVPEPHLKDSSAWPSPESDPTVEGRRQRARICSGKTKPATAFAAVRYRDWWFWVDNGDRQTKRVLSTVILIFTLTEAGSSDKLPLITTPAQ